MLLIPFPGLNAGRFFTTFTEFQVPTYLPTVYCIASSSTLHCDIIYLPRQAEPLLVIAVITVFRSSVFGLRSTFALINNLRRIWTRFRRQRLHKNGK